MKVDPRRPSLDSPDHHGLWGLWDMMELKAGAFISAANELAATVAYISGSNTLGAGLAFDEKRQLDNEIDRPWILERLGLLQEHLRSLGADVAMLCAADAETIVSDPWATWGTAKDALSDLNNTLRRELSLKIILVSESQEANYYAPKEPLFGQNFADRFKERGAFELDEAAKSLALSRPTAAVFHLMRILEVGIGSLSSCLNIPSPIKPVERNWAVILKRIKEDGIDKKWPTAADRMSGDGLLFEGLHASLDAVKNPWRNETMHVSGKYTDDEAKHIFVAVEGFMKKLSDRMDEGGEPKA